MILDLKVSSYIWHKPILESRNFCSKDFIRENHEIGGVLSRNWFSHDENFPLEYLKTSYFPIWIDCLQSDFRLRRSRADVYIARRERKRLNRMEDKSLKSRKIKSQVAIGQYLASFTCNKSYRRVRDFAVEKNKSSPWTLRMVSCMSSARFTYTRFWFA